MTRKARATFLLNPIGSAGDVHPHVGIGRELARRGHHVKVLTNPIHRGVVESQGLELVPIGTRAEMIAVGSDPRIHVERTAWKLALRWGAVGTMRQTFETIARLYRPGRTVVAAPGMGFGARIARESLGVPLATLHVEPDKFRSLRRSPRMPPPMLLADWVPRSAKALQLWLADRMVIDPVLGPETNTFRRELGLEPVTRFLNGWWHSPDLAVGLYPEWYAPPQPDGPPQVRLTGFPRWDPPGDPAVVQVAETFYSRGEPPLVFAPGTAGPADRVFFETAVAVCKKLGARGVLLGRNRSVVPSTLPDVVIHLDFLSFSDFLPRSLALVHHGGTGTGAQALAAGIPQVVCPWAFNQPDDAARLADLGVAEVVRPRKVAPGTLSAALSRLLSSSEVAERCGEIAARFVDVDPIGETCDLLESLIGGDRA